MPTLSSVFERTYKLSLAINWLETDAVYKKKFFYTYIKGDWLRFIMAKDNLKCRWKSVHRQEVDDH